MQELAEHGAKVLHAQAVEWARRGGIRIWARATHVDGGGTAVGADGSGAQACGIATGRNLVRVRLVGLPTELGELLAAAQASLWRLDGEGLSQVGGSDPGRACALFSRDDLPDWPALRRTLEERLGARVVIEEDLAAVSVVGTALGAATQVARALGVAARLAIDDVAAEHSPLRLTLVVRPDAVPALARGLHEAFGLEAASP